MTTKRGDFSADNRIYLLGAIAIFIGACSTVTAFLLVKLINLFTNIFYFGSLSFAASTPSTNKLGLWVVAIPALGGLLIGLMARFGSERIRGHGIPEALEAILFGKSIMQLKVAILKPLSSAISIGSGGPFGAEGPIIMTGGAAGSLIAQCFHMTAAERKTLLVSGAAAGMSAIFASPMAAILLAVELLLFEWKPRSLFPVAVASITAAVLRPYVLGAGPVFPFQTQVDMTVTGLLSCCAAGVIAGFFSAAVSGLLYKVEDAFHRLPCHWMWWCVLGGFIVGLGGYFQPRALGVGYDVIDDLLNSRLVLQAALSLLAVKSFIWVVSLGSGTSGGVLAPLLMMGCGLGLVEASIFPVAFKALFPIISMAAVMAGMMRAPFTAVMFALELTHNVNAMLPTLAASIASYAVTVIVMKRSILTEKVARRGYDIFREYGIDPLETTRIDEIMTKNVMTIPMDLSLGEVIASYFSGKKKFRGYPVVDAAGGLSGILTASDILEANLDHVPGDVRTASFTSQKRLVTAYPHESCREAAERMASMGIGRLPVVAPEDERRLVGMITRSDLLKPRLKHHDLEKKRERMFPRR